MHFAISMFFARSKPPHTDTHGADLPHIGVTQVTLEKYYPLYV